MIWIVILREHQSNMKKSLLWATSDAYGLSFWMLNSMIHALVHLSQNPAFNRFSLPLQHSILFYEVVDWLFVLLMSTAFKSQTMQVRLIFLRYFGRNNLKDILDYVLINYKLYCFKVLSFWLLHILYLHCK